MADEKTTKSLERKTKKELIEIILRKDSVENNLREANKHLSDSNENYKLEIEEQKELYYSSKERMDELAEDYQSIYDKNAMLTREIIKLKGINKFLIGTLGVAAICIFIMAYVCVSY